MKQTSIFFIFLNLNLIEQISNIFTKISKINSKRKLSEYQNFITNIYFSEKDEKYFIKLYIGDELIPQTYILDTTFPLISSPCDLCNNCTRHYFPYYKINNNTDIINCPSYQCLLITNLNYCKEEKCYFKKGNNLNENKNIEGFIVNSKIFINNTNNYSDYYNNIPIGCTIKEGDYYKNKEVNGIIGLNNNRNTFIDNLYNLNYIQNNLFTICLSKKKGYLSLGKINTNSENINYINLLDSSLKSNLFEFKINNIQIEKEIINEVVIAYISSEDNISYFPKIIYNLIIDILKKEKIIQLFEYDEKKGYCKIINNKDDKNKIYEIFPKIILNFETYNYEWESKSYIIENKNDDNQIILCLGIKELIDKENRLILGANFMLNHEIIFDKQHQRIAFVNSDCQEFERNKTKNELVENNVNSDINIEETNKNNSQNNEIETKINNNNIKETFSKSYLYIEQVYNDINKTYNDLGENNSISINENKFSSSIQNIIKNTSIEHINKTNILITTVLEKKIKNDLNLSSTINYDDIFTNKTFISNNTIINDDNSNVSTFNNNIFQTSNIKTYINNNTINDYTINTEYNLKSGVINQTNLYNNKNSIHSSIEEEVNNYSNISYISSSYIVSSTYMKNKENKYRDETTSLYLKKTTFLYKDINISKTNINVENAETKDILNKTNYNINTEVINNEDKKNITYESTINKENNKDKHLNRSIFGIFGDFLKNKLIYFLFAILGTILGLLAIIFISCAIISCIKFFKRDKNYIEQIDYGIPTGSFSSRS